MNTKALELEKRILVQIAVHFWGMRVFLMRMYNTCLNQLFVRVWPLNHDCTPCYPYQRECKAQYSSVHCFIIRTVRLSWIHFYPSQLGHNRRSKSQNSGGNFTSVTTILNKTEESCYTVSSLTAGTHYCTSCIYVTLLCFPGSPRLWNMAGTRWNMKHAHRFHSRLKNWILWFSSLQKHPQQL